MPRAWSLKHFAEQNIGARIDDDRRISFRVKLCADTIPTANIAQVLWDSDRTIQANAFTNIAENLLKR